MVTRPQGRKPANGNHFSSLPCPRCGRGPTQVKSSECRIRLFGTVIRRYRECTKCERMFITYETYAPKRRK